MLSLVTSATQTVDSSWLPAVITGSCVVIAALATALITNRRSKGKVRPTPNVTPSKLSEYSGTQNDFTKLVIADNKSIREEMAALKAEFDAKLKAVVNRQQVVGDGFVALSNGVERAKIKPILIGDEQAKIDAARTAIASDLEWPTLTTPN